MPLMAKQKEHKTNAQREVEAAGFAAIFREIELTDGFHMSGLELAQSLGQDPDATFKTLVTIGKTGEHYVFMVPVACELDLKKAAAVVGEKSIAMIKTKELLPLTGYVHGGCSPLGMKKQFRTTIDETAELFNTISFSAGRVGAQIEMAPNDLAHMIRLTFADITK